MIKPFTTETFSITSGEYLRTLMGLWLPRHGWKVAIPILLCAAIGVALADERLILVALMLVFIVAPMGMSFLYSYYMLTPEVARAILPQRVTAQKDGNILIEYTDPERPAQSVTLTPGDIRQIKHTPTSTVIVLHARRLQFIIIPHQAVVREINA